MTLITEHLDVSAVRLAAIQMPAEQNAGLFTVDKCNLDPLLNYKFVAIILKMNMFWGNVI